MNSCTEKAPRGAGSTTVRVTPQSPTREPSSISAAICREADSVKPALSTRTHTLSISDRRAATANTPASAPHGRGLRTWTAAATIATTPQITSHVGAKSRGEPWCGTLKTTGTLIAAVRARPASTVRMTARRSVGAREVATAAGARRNPSTPPAASATTLTGKAHAIAMGIDWTPRPTAANRGRNEGSLSALVTRSETDRRSRGSSPGHAIARVRTITITATVEASAARRRCGGVVSHTATGSAKITCSTERQAPTTASDPQT